MTTTISAGTKLGPPSSFFFLHLIIFTYYQRNADSWAERRGHPESCPSQWVLNVNAVGLQGAWGVGGEMLQGGDAQTQVEDSVPSCRPFPHAQVPPGCSTLAWSRVCELRFHLSRKCPGDVDSAAQRMNGKRQTLLEQTPIQNLCCSCQPSVHCGTAQNHPDVREPRG